MKIKNLLLTAVCAASMFMPVAHAQTSFSVRVNSSTDDAEEEATSGAMYDNSSDLELVYDDFVTDNQLIGMRFTNVTIPQGAIITRAYIQFQVDETKANDPCNLYIFQENNLTPTTYNTTSGNISGRTYLMDSVAWNPDTWAALGDQGPAQATSDISRLVQKMVNNASWTSGNAMAFKIAGTGTRTAEAYDGDASNAPQLNIEYIIPSNFSVRVSASADDAEEAVSTGVMDVTSSDLELAMENTSQYIGMKFNNITIPAGAHVANAYIQFQVDETNNQDPNNLQIFIENSITPASYSSAAGDISSRAYVNDSISFSFNTWSTVGNQGADQRTVNISRLVKKMLNNGSWTSGNNLAFMIKGTGRRTAESYDGDAANAPQLVIDYVPVDYTLQLLHASDLEGNVDAIDEAPIFAGIVEAFENQYANNTLLISSGDNWIPSPFFNAAAEGPIEDSLRAILSDFYGTSLNSLEAAKGRIDVSLMNVMGFDAATFGNHEFDAGTTALADIILPDANSTDIFWMGAQFPYLSANLDFSTSSDLGSAAVTGVQNASNFISDINNAATVAATKKIAPATVITRGTEQIGVVAATTQLLNTISSPGDVSVVGTPTGNDMVQLAAVLQPYIDSLTNLGIDKIILSTHLQQFSLEQQLAGLVDDVDIIIAGGSDFLLADQTDVLRAGDVAAGPYPYSTTTLSGDPLLIVSTDGQYSYVGRLVVSFDANGLLMPFTVDEHESGAYPTLTNTLTNLYGTNDPYAVGTKTYYAERLTNSIKNIVAAKDGNTFGKTNHFLDGNRSTVRLQESNLGDLTADANLWIAKQYDPTVAVSLKNGGGIRDFIGVVDQLNGQLLPPQPNAIAMKDSLEISQLDIEAALSFNNALKVVDTDPAGLKALLEHGIGNWDGISTQGRMPQVGGLRFSFDPTQASGSRIQNMAIVDSAGNVLDSVVVNGMIHGNASRVIKLVSLNFMIDSDGDGYPFSTSVSNGVDLDSSNVSVSGNANFTAVGSEQDALAEYLSAYFSTTPFDMEETDETQDERIQILSKRTDNVFSAASQNFTLQLLHASDLEGSVDAIENAPRFAAIVDHFDDMYANTLTISSGDNWIPSPFFNAASEAPIQDSLRDILSDFYGVNLNALTTSKGRIDISLMNVIGFDASAFGNHEFDATTTAVSDIILAGGSSSISWMGAQFPYLSANLDFSASNLAAASVTDIRNASEFITDLNNPSTAAATKKIAPATVINRGGEQIGIIGATTQLLQTISSPGDVTVVSSPTANDMNQLAGVLQPYIDSLTNMGINKIILTSHLQQFALEQQLAGLLNGIDIIIAGGSDFLLADGNDVLRPGDAVQGPYPYQTVNADNDPVMIVSTDGQYSYVGRLVVDFDANGVLIPTSLDTVVSGAYATLASVVTSIYGTNNPYEDGSKGYFAERLVNSVKDIVIAKDGNIFGKTNHFLDGRRGTVRTEESNLGDLTADANLWMARKYDPSVAVSLKNGGGIRAEIGYIDLLTSQLLPPQPNAIAGKDSLEVSQLDIEAALSFNNGLTVTETTPAGLKALLEHGISNWDGISTNGQMPQIGGMEFSFDPTQTAGSRIVNIAIVDSMGYAIDSVIVNGSVYGDPNRIIKMVALNFLVNSDGDGYPFSTETSNPVDIDNSNITYTQQAMFADLGSEQNALAEYLLAKYAVNAFDMEETTPNLDERIQILSLRNDSVLNSNNIGIKELHIANNLKLYPNPAVDVVNVETSNGDLITAISVYSLSGVQVKQLAVSYQNKTQVNLSDLADGSYLVKITTANGTATQVLIVK